MASLASPPMSYGVAVYIRANRTYAVQDVLSQDGHSAYLIRSRHTYTPTCLLRHVHRDPPIVRNTHRQAVPKRRNGSLSTSARPGTGTSMARPAEIRTPHGGLQYGRSETTPKNSRSPAHRSMYRITGIKKCHDRSSLPHTSKERPH
jgi:hypothetical protein